ncbi:MAG: ABC transporter substrate-binding protein [Protaetiibacter sp.]
MRTTALPDATPRLGWSRRTIALVASSSALALALAGCTAPTDDEGTTTLRVGIASLADTDSLDPASASTTGGYAFATQVFDTLTVYGTSGSWEPSLAESVEPGDTADVWTVTLRDAVWQDGDPVTADDLISTVTRWFDQELPPASALPFIDPDGLEKIDDQTVQFTLLYPTVTFPEALTSPTTSIVPSDFDPEDPIGSGPFALETNDPGIQMTFSANEDYWGTVPSYDELELISFADASSEVTALLAGQVDVAANLDPTLVAQVEASEGHEVFDYPTSGALTWAMNVDTEPLDDPVVRQALRLAVDRQELIDQVYSGYAQLGNDIWSPFDPLYSSDLAQREYDPDAAMAMLEEAGYTLPVAIELWGAPNQPTSDRQNEVLVEQAAAAGFDITFNQVDVATFYGDAYGTYPLSLSYWGYLGIFDQAAFTITATAPYNSTHWTDAEYDALYNEAIQTVDDTARKALVEQMQTIEYERGSYIVPLFMDALVAHSAEVSGFEAYPNTDGAIGYHFSILSIE